MTIDFWRTLTNWLESGVSCALTTVVRGEGSIPRHPGAKMLVRTDGLIAGSIGGGALEQEVIRRALEVIPQGQPQMASFTLKPDLQMACGGSVDILIEPLFPGLRLYLFGAGHIAQSLCPMAAQLGYQVTIFDERTEYASPQKCVGASAFVHSFDPEKWPPLIFDGRTHCVVVSPSHEIDTTLVLWLITRELGYLGMIGSRRKRQALEKRLAAQGVPAAALARLHTPIGLPIQAETPPEIAVSIAAELVQIRHGAGAAQTPTTTMQLQGS